METLPLIVVLVVLPALRRYPNVDGVQSLGERWVRVVV